MDTIELLVKLDELSGWRKKELIQAQYLAENSSNVESTRYLCRVWVLIMYAHCDSFLKQAASAYFQYLKLNFDSITDYKHDLIWFLTHAENNFIATDKKYKSFDLYMNGDENFFFSDHIVKSVLNNSSFSYKHLRNYCDWLLQIKFPYSEIQFFCRKLKENRDKISHGEEVYIDSPEDCKQWNKDTIDFIDKLKNAIIEKASS